MSYPSPDWQLLAACAGTDGEAFFPDMGGSSREAKKVCAVCDVSAECLEYALTNGIRHGIWGGLSAHHRKRLQAEQAGGGDA